ncbi:DUF1990 family protein [Lysobacter korlensis]|uniref:DUF1990 family protein n=1 Tax=Lysobacter korlensis TaxID=553636 RepID=A0ABV6RMQ1_9GAMM
MTAGLPLWERRVTYASVGGTQAEDLVEYPPRGYRPLVRRARIGHGDARFAHATATALGWGIHKRSGFDVELEASPAEVTDGTYVAVGFNTKGIPVVPAGGDRDALAIGPDGTALLKPGDSATLRLPAGPITFECPVRVIYVVDDPACKGFACGTLPGHPSRGEEAFLVEQEEDGSVWLTVRAFFRPAGFGWWLASPLLRIVQARITARYLRALSGPIPKAADQTPAIPDAERAAAG